MNNLVADSANQSKLYEILLSEISNQSGMISFRDFMDICLYYPEYGYYQTNSEKTGKHGDFYTSPNVSKVFGEVIADYIYSLWIELQEPQKFSIIEFGAGKGQLAYSIIEQLQNYPKLNNSFIYYIIDASNSFQKLQQQLLTHKYVKWVADVNEIEQPITGCILSNELLDAFPVHWVRYHDNILQEKYVAYDKADNQFIIKYKQASKQLQEYFTLQSVELIEGQEAEVNFMAYNWLGKCATALAKGYILTIDYGFLAEELYAPHRKHGTLLCYYRHTVNDNPLQRIGQQDITSHVNFTQLMRWGESLGLDTISYITQQQFLMEQGILSKISNNVAANPFDQAYKRNASIKQLIMPTTMGEAFKVLIQKKVK